MRWCRVFVRFFLRILVCVLLCLRRGLWHGSLGSQIPLETVFLLTLLFFGRIDFLALTRLQACLDLHSFFVSQRHNVKFLKSGGAVCGAQWEAARLHLLRWLALLLGHDEMPIVGLGIDLHKNTIELMVERKVRLNALVSRLLLL